MISFFGLGFILGLRHALDADHVAAVAALATRSRLRRDTVRLAMAWGAGHAATLLAVCVFVLASGETIAPGMAGVLELLVGLMLFGLGLDVMRRVIRQRIHAHIHRHEGTGDHLHIHSHEGEAAHAASAHAHEHPSGLPARAALVGLMHGLAGSAALLLLSLGQTESFVYGLGYVALFGVGSMAGMGLLSVALALPLRLGARFVGWGYNGVHAAIGVATVGLGGVIVGETAPTAAVYLGLI